MKLKVSNKPQQGRGKTQKTICPKCDKEYLKTAWSTENRKWIRIGLFCPSPTCYYIEKDYVELEDTEEGEAEI
jgi:hypothetical protein